MAAKPNEEELSALDGTVESVIFQSEEDGYTVLRLSTGEGDPVTVVGCIPEVCPGELVTVHGRWTNHATFGQQFKAETAERRLPTGAAAIFHYLASGVIRGIGDATARRIVDTFGADTLRVMSEEPERLAKVRGITPKRAREIHQDFLQKAGMRNLLSFLTGNGFSVALCARLWRMYGERAETLVKADPYLLVGEDWGVPFAQADALAASVGVDAAAPQRVQAGLLFVLRHNLGNGHVFLPKDKLLAAGGRLLHVEADVLADGLDALDAAGEVVVAPVAGVEACYLAGLYEDECAIAQRIRIMAARELHPPRDLEGRIDRIQEKLHIVYAPQQRQAVATAARRQVMLLTGGPGTGKTTSLRGILALFDQLGLETALAAPTGRAAKRLGELCQVEASTIHRLLEAAHDPETGRLIFSHDEEDPLKADAVIVDEMSMVDVPLMAALLAALGDDCRLVLVGDPDQLPSVGPGCLFDHLIRSDCIPTVRLTEIFRQAQESAIVMNAHRINRGVMPALDNHARDFFFLRRRDAQRAVDTIVELCRTRLPQRMGIPPEQIQVLSPTRKYATGTGNLNLALQAALNPPVPGAPTRQYGGFTYRVGDRVMQVKNNYDILWRDAAGRRSGMGVFNGDIGVITDISPKGEVVTVDFEDKLVEYTPDMLPELEPAYAITVHKSQGSEYRAVILAALDGAPMLLTRGVLYTAVTRARELFIAVGDDQVIATMEENNRQSRRYSALRARLAGETEDV